MHFNDAIFVWNAFIFKVFNHIITSTYLFIVVRMQHWNLHSLWTYSQIAFIFRHFKHNLSLFDASLGWMMIIRSCMTWNILEMYQTLTQNVKVLISFHTTNAIWYNALERKTNYCPDIAWSIYYIISCCVLTFFGHLEHISNRLIWSLPSAFVLNAAADTMLRSFER